MPARFFVKQDQLGEPMRYSFEGLQTEEINEMIGRVLTIAEATMPSGSQLDAFKSLLKQEVWRTFNAASLFGYYIDDKEIPWPEGQNATYPNREMTVCNPWTSPMFDGHHLPDPLDEEMEDKRKN